MRTHRLFFTTILSTAMVLSVTACSANPDKLTSSKVRTDSYANDHVPGDNSTARDAAEDFIGRINYARVALAQSKGKLAQEHIVEARDDMDQMKAFTAEDRIIQTIESGRIIYSYDTDYKYHYFPIETGGIEVKKMGNGPIWAKNDLAVLEAEVVYLTVDLSSYTASTRLDNAEADIKAGRLKAADMELAKLTNEVVTVDDTTPMPIDKARDNIVLTSNFIANGNYAGARYALKHADKALDEMQKDDTYSLHRTDLVAMRKDVQSLQSEITKNNPTITQKANTRLNKWWSELKAWPHKEK